MYDSLIGALRSVVRNRRFTLTLVIQFAVAIGTATAVFSIVDLLVLRPVTGADLRQVVEFEPYERVPPGIDAIEWWSRSASLQTVGSYQVAEFNLMQEGYAKRVLAGLISPSFFSVLGVSPSVGRDFGNDDQTPGSGQVAILSHRLWASQFNKSRTVLGKVLNLDGRSFTVVGVMPPGFSFPEGVQVWLPRLRGSFEGILVGRLNANANREMARAEVGTRAAQLHNEAAGAAKRPVHPPYIVSVTERDVVRYKSVLLVVCCGIFTVLLVACGNGAALLLTRAASRRAEMVLRLCLGAPRRTLVCHLLLESLVLSAVTAVAAILLASFLMQIARTIGASRISRLADVGLSWNVLAFAIALSALTGVVAWLAPALQFSVAAPLQALKGNWDARTHQRYRNVLITFEVACSLLLLFGAGLMVRTLSQMLSVDIGLDPKAVITARWALPPASREKARVFYSRMVEELQRVPGVQAVGTVNSLPLGERGGSLSIDLIGTPGAELGSRYIDTQRYWTVTGEYFKVMGIPLIRGRFLTDSDDEAGASAIVISRTLARRVWQDQDPIGKQIRIEGEDGSRTVVGVVGDVRSARLSDPPGAQFYLHRLQAYRGRRALGGTAVIKVSRGSAISSALLRAMVTSLDPGASLSDIQTMDQVIAGSIGSTRVTALVLILFAALALIVTLTGVYALVSYATVTRTREIGIRMALGATRVQVLASLLRQSATVAALGIAGGLIAAAFLTRLLSSMLFGVKPLDPLTLTAASAIVFVAAIGSALRPALAAVSGTPLRVLRHD